MGNLADRPRSGRPTVLTAAQKRYIRLLAARDPTINATKIKAEVRATFGLEVSTQTIRKLLAPGWITSTEVLASSSEFLATSTTEIAVG